MPIPAEEATLRRGTRTHAVRVAEVRAETADARSFVLDIPPRLAAEYTYRAGQFLTLRVRIGAEVHHRSYSMSSSPVTDPHPQITVKRIPQGLVSTWLTEQVRPGDTVEVTVPMGAFVLPDSERDIVAFAAGSGVTPVFSIVKTALATTTRRVRLFYANRDRDSIIFGTGLAELAARHPHRLTVVHHIDAESGLLTAERISEIFPGTGDHEHFLCGPAPFMDVVRAGLSEGGVPDERVHVERFTTGEADAAEEPAAGEPAQVTIRCGRRTATGEHRGGTTVLQVARALGLRPPSSCETGSCATCIARVVEGSTVMRNNEVLTAEEIADGWVLTCQAVPTGPLLRVDYD
ncbi:ferredoxin--NADP reductase [Nocardia abscessus]|uniref:ferredoxin--NADP reductase n=1 Tax=Nocardia abscessus TaxID=120957 RepID=UPI0002F79FE1|nr:ferredoxin--NADP reductase [Nocardia abscessus]MCC3331351.1 ferredoxin--NADP reductase [Nocardia abscessus]